MVCIAAADPRRTGAVVAAVGIAGSGDAAVEARR